MSRLARVVFVLASLALCCEDPAASPTAGSNSNWLVSCDVDAHCPGETSCVCTRCTRSCSSDGDCAGLGDARCVQPEEAASLSECRDAEPSGLCLPRCEAGGCTGEQACVAGACVLDPAPEGDFCAAVAAGEDTARAFEDELLALVRQMREAGGVTCGANAPSDPAPELLRFRGSLRCAARVLAVDVDARTARGLLDASGRTTRERLAAAGYTDTLWAEAYAVDAATPSDALAVMLGDESSCLALTRGGYTDFGAGAFGTASVVTLGAE